jgi:predicted heme/steroid binding protein
MRHFTRRELAFFNGEKGAPVYLAHEGLVYDASSSFLWQRGEHQARHKAGRDLTAALDQAPHGPQVLARLPIVGALVDGDKGW